MSFQAGRVSDRAGLGPAHRGWSSFELLPRRRRTTSPAQVFLDHDARSLHWHALRLSPEPPPVDSILRVGPLAHCPPTG